MLTHLSCVDICEGAEIMCGHRGSRDTRVGLHTGLETINELTRECVELGGGGGGGGGGVVKVKLLLAELIYLGHPMHCCLLRT